MSRDSHARLDRRTFLEAGGVGLATAITAGRAAGQSGLSVTFDDQQSNGETVVVAEIQAPFESLLYLRDVAGEPVGGHPAGGAYRFGPDETAENVTVELEASVSDDQILTARLQESNGSQSVRDSALISLDGPPPERVERVGPTLVDADSDAGFEYPYFLYAPTVHADAEPTPVVVEPNNTGAATDDFAEHRAAARDTSRDGIGREIADNLDAPFVVPAFPRPRRDPVDGTHYVHSLDDTTMAIENGPLERVDLQLLAMVDDATRRLRDRRYPVDDDIMLAGFSAAANFVDRFAVLHPDRVQSVTAGGLNGMALLPLEEVDGRTLPFHVGIADVAALTGEPVDLDALDEVDQFLFMGSEDGNDTIPYDDAWTDDDLRQTALAVYGDDMVNERFPRCQRAYREAGVDAQFRVYDGVAHTPRPALEDIVAFHRRSRAGEDVSDFGETLVAEPRFDATPATPAPGAPVEFDATGSDGGIDGISRYLWAFDDGETAFGPTATHTFDEAGEYTITLILVHESGRETTMSSVLAVGSSAGSSTKTARTTETPTATDTTPTTQTATPTATADDSETPTTGDGAGFGLSGAVASLGGAGWLLRRRRGDDEADE